MQVGRTTQQGGWTLLELMAGLVIVGVLSSFAYGSYTRVMDDMKVTQATVDLSMLLSAIEKYRTLHKGSPPESLTEIGANIADPWGRPYQYLSFETLPGNNVGPVRKDHNLVPLNSRFDLYSKGPDGQSKPPLTAKPSRDDIIVANDGTFIGKASDY